MITSIDLINEYCKKQNLRIYESSQGDRVNLGKEILYLTEHIDNNLIKMANVKLQHCTNINRVVVIRLKTDVSLNEKLIPAGTEMMVVHFEKNHSMTNLKRSYLREYFNFIQDTFKSKMSTNFINENKMPQIIGKIKQTNKKIYWQELTTQLVPIINELSKYNFNVTITSDKLALKNSKYVWNWI